GLTLVGESDAKARHSEILMVAAMTRPELQCRVDNGLGESRKSSGEEGVLTCLGDEMKLVRMIFLTEDEVPGEVSHQTDMAGNTKFKAGTDLAERSDMIIVNRIIS